MSVGTNKEAIVFVDNNRVIKEILYPEFEAVLDHVVGLSDLKSRKAFAVYLTINPQLYITAAVFFTIDFDDNGYADRSWNLPLQHLSRHTGTGPDLGAGPIKLACRSQCSVAWHQRSLWDPVLSTGDHNTLSLLATAIKRNRLGLAVIEADKKADKASDNSSLKAADQHKAASAASINQARQEIEATLAKKYKAQYQARVASLNEESNLRIAAIKSEAQEYIEKIQRHYRSERDRLNLTLETTKQLFSEEKHRNIKLKNTLQSQAKDMRNARERFQGEIEQSKEIEQVQLLALEEQFELEAKAKIDAVTAELKEMLDMREVELFYRDEQIKRLNEEVTLLRQEKASLLAGGGDRILQKMVESGITFVTYHPGIEHLTIPASNLSQYMDSPLAYVADKCAVDISLYQQWLKHQQLPVCSHTLADGALCAAPISKVEVPSRFIIGQSDRCHEHSNSLDATLTEPESVSESD
ncbi:MAG: hypothetical protein WCY88_08170 [Spongiibacteraceae bacterium]